MSADSDDLNHDDEVTVDSEGEHKYLPRDHVLTIHQIKSRSELSPGCICGHTLTALDDRRVLSLGGANEDKIQHSAFIFDLIQQKWEEMKQSGYSAPGALFGHTATKIKDRIFVFGGLTYSTTFSFEESDNRRPAGNGSAFASNETKSGYHSPAEARNSFFQSRSGGDGKVREEATNGFHCLHLGDLQWKQFEAAGKPPTPRYSHSAVGVDDKWIVIFGGCTEPAYNKSTNDLYIFDVERGRWEEPRTYGVGPSPRHGHTCVHIGGHQCLFFGGMNEDDGNGTRYNDLFLLDLDSMSWIAAESYGTTPAPRAFHTAAFINNEMHILAGETPQIISDYCLLNVNSMVWTRPLSTVHFEHTLQAATVISDKLLVFGGLSYVSGLLDDFFFANTVAITAIADNDYTFKVIIVGDSNVGKSCLMTRFVEDRFNEVHVATIGVDFKTVITLVESKVIKLQLWDTAGQERFQSIGTHFYRGADGAILVYDVTNRKSFENIEKWIEQVLDALGEKKEDRKGNNKEKEGIITLLVGNKADLESERQVSRDAGEDLAGRLGCIFIESSARNAKNVDQAFLGLAKELVLKRKSKTKGQGEKRSSAIKLESVESHPKQSGGCCK